MAESSSTADRLHAGGQDLLSQGLEESTTIVPASGMTGHPAEDQMLEEATAPSGDETPLAERPAPRFKYQTHEAAEAAYAEAERKMGEEAQRRAQLEREVELYRQHAALLEQQVHRAHTVEAPLLAPSQDFNAKEHFAQAYQRMGQLNPAAEDFEAQQQAIFVEALDTAFSRLRHTTALTEAQIVARIDASVQTLLATRDQQAIQQTERERLMTKLQAHATANGLDVTPPDEANPLGGAHYHDIMLAVDRNLYPQDADETAAIAAVVNLVKTRRGVTTTAPAGSPPNHGVIPANPSPRTAAQRAQALNTPMERSGMGRPQNAPAEEDTRSMSISEMLERSLSVRRP